MTDRELPPLPTESYIGEEGLWERRVVLTEESVREYGRAVERAAYERAASLCDKADKSTHPADLADRIRALKEGA